MTEADTRPVLIAYDGSEPAAVAIACAGALLAGRPAVVLTVWAPIEPVTPAAAIAVPGRVALAGARGLDVEERSRAERTAAEGAGLARVAGFTAEPLVVRRDGAPWHAIVECAAELGAAAIVTGTRGRSRAVAAVLGSTAEGVLHHAHRPVVLVPGE
jgi:nucleotide-binding universal stress UspA family protein